MDTISRRTFVRSSALAAAACAAPSISFAQPKPASGALSPVRLGIATYTFRNFARAKMIPWVKQLNIASLNCKDTQDHLPMDPAAEAQALADYNSNANELHAAGTVYFPKDEDEDIRSKLGYAQRAGIKVNVAGDPAPATLCPASRNSSGNTTSEWRSTTTARRCGDGKISPRLLMS